MPAAMSTVEIPIARVTVLEDRAQVERRARCALAAGRQTLRVEGVSPVAVDRSLKARVEGAGVKVVDARVARAFKPRPPGGLPADASELRRRVRALELRGAELDADLARLAARLEVARAARADVLRSISELSAVGPADPDGWRRQLEALRDEEGRTEGAHRIASAERGRVHKGLAEARAALAAAEAPDEELLTAIELTVEAAAEVTSEIRLVYLVPCAVWRPRYRATLVTVENAARVGLETEASVWQRTGEAWTEVELALSTARPTLGVSPPSLQDDVLRARPKSEEEKRSVDVSVREEVIQTVTQGGPAPTSELPGLDDAGEVRVLVAPRKVTVPPDGQAHRVPLGAFEAPAATRLFCAPERSPLVSLVATFENRGQHVLLAGPVDLVRESGFVGRSQLKFAAVGEQIRLSFGSEDHLRVTRQELQRREESRLTGRRTTEKTVKLFVSNAGTDRVKLEVEERIPVSEVKEVEVALRPKDTSPQPVEVTRDGIVRFQLELPPREHVELKLGYDVSAAAKVVGL
jgi:uncharacterized protein (TIGR02231 family)